jgi:hypothetical protein
LIPEMRYTCGRPYPGLPEAATMLSLVCLSKVLAASVIASSIYSGGISVSESTHWINMAGPRLSYAVWCGNPAVVELLSKKGAQPSSEDSGRQHVLSAAGRGDEGAVKMLLETAKVDPDVKNEEGKTALHVAAQNGYPQVVSTLLRKFSGHRGGSRERWPAVGLGDREEGTWRVCRGHTRVESRAELQL